jgi:uncharacterized coiled-coil DUF342 family protein
MSADKMTAMGEALLTENWDRVAALKIREIRYALTRYATALTVVLDPEQRAQIQQQIDDTLAMVAGCGITDLSNTKQARAQYRAHIDQVEYENRVEAYAFMRGLRELALDNIARAKTQHESVLETDEEHSALTDFIAQMNSSLVEVDQEIAEIEAYLFEHMKL